MIEEAKKVVEQFYAENPQGVVVIWGATATGKTGLSVALSDFFDLEVVSSDSRQIFRGMDIGTDKVSQEIRDRVPHHQINIVNPDERYTSGEWKKDTEMIIDDIVARGKKPFVVGGTGLYIDTIYKNFIMPNVPPDMDFRAMMEKKEEADPGVCHRLLQQIDPDEALKLPWQSTRYIIRALEIHEKTGKPKSHFMKRREPRWPLLMLGLWRSKEETNKRINARVKEMLAGGLIEETQGLIDQGYPVSLQSMQGIGYKETVAYLQGEYDKEKLEEKIKRVTHYLAKKQRTWFRRYIADEKIGFPGVSYHMISLD